MSIEAQAIGAQALKWEMVPVITDFDPRFNNSKPLWFEKLYQPFLRGDLRTRWVTCQRSRARLLRTAGDGWPMCLSVSAA